MVKKVAQYMADVLEDSRDKVQENLLANGGTVMFVAQCGPFITKIRCDCQDGVKGGPLVLNLNNILLFGLRKRPTHCYLMDMTHSD